MEWNENIDLTKRKKTSRLIVEHALRRGWRIAGFKTNMGVYLIYIPGRDKPLRIFSASPPTMSYPAVKMAKDKFITSSILGEAGLPVPDELLLSNAYDKAEAERFLEQHGRVVVKPLDGAHGKGITTDITEIGQLHKAIATAGTYSRGDWTLMQEQVQGVDVRIVCLEHKYVDAISRSPAAVVGDGVHTVRQLIETTNTGEERGENYKSRLNIIQFDKVEDYIGQDGLASVPRAGQVVQVIGVSNIGMGGDAQNLRDDIPPFMRELAERAAAVMDLPVCGVDFMVDHVPTADDTMETLRPKIIEVNDCPTLSMHEGDRPADEPTFLTMYLDYLAGL